MADANNKPRIRVRIESGGWRGLAYEPSEEDRRELERMLQKERIARVRHWFVTQWNANARMTVTERVELRQDRMFWKRIGMRLYGVADRAVPKLLKPGLAYAPDFCEHCFRDLPGKRCVCPRVWAMDRRELACCQGQGVSARKRDAGVH